MIFTGGALGGGTSPAHAQTMVQNARIQQAKRREEIREMIEERLFSVRLDGGL
jgi:hypothetical protein